MDQAYVGMGGNIGDSIAILNQSLEEMRAIHEITNLRCSNFYKTSPVEAIPQADYVNAVCTFQTSLKPIELHKRLEEIERKMGKLPKPKNHPRVIDLDLLLHGLEVVDEKNLKIPHPKWNQRLFVLIPMRELVSRLAVKNKTGELMTVDLEKMIQHFDNVNNEQLEILR
ncbi:2-amino-4-hydroxy-6-hydroxymethyldihydropteridine diphosphokinase [Waddlia chondrophila]|nr:2-amino-4-hydroxy-6-hydroxymethyldihydropteridine diphosphokinase [Waddlia chondrophila]